MRPTSVANANLFAAGTSQSSSSPRIMCYGVIDGTSNQECPCCLHLETEGRQTLNDEDGNETDDNESLGLSLLNIGGTSSHINSYQTSKILAEGWVHLKGSGSDWLGSRSWKPRYTKLVLARVPGYEAAGTDVPVLLIYWFPSSPNPSTTIVLDSTVVVPLDKSDKTLWNAHCLDIIHATSSDSKRITRRMTVGNQSARDAWVLTLTQALLDYEKCKAQVKKQKQAVAQQREQQNNVTSGTCAVNGNGSNISIAGGSCCANPRPAPIIHSTIGGRHALVLHQNHRGGTRIMQPKRSLPSDYSEDQFMTIPTTPTNEWKSPLRSVRVADERQD